MPDGAVIVAIHQPNYVPWLGFFAKLARADIFLILDDAQFTKGGYINRAAIDVEGTPRWLTIPVSYRFGDAISRVRAADSDWTHAHCDVLNRNYAGAREYAEIWPWLIGHYSRLPCNELAASNQALIEAIARQIGLRTTICRASELSASDAKGDDRLIALVRACGGESYLSGRGGANYQDPSKFAAAGIRLVYNRFVEVPYDQGRPAFLPGLSILDCLFHLGWKGTAALLSRASCAE